MDTSRDYRLLLVKDAVERLEKIVRVWNLNYPIHKSKVTELIKKAKGEVDSLLYSYLPLTYLLKHNALRTLFELGERLAQELLPPKGTLLDRKTRFYVAEIRYALLQMINLRPRLLLGEENQPENAVDIVGVEIASVSKHPNASKLFITKAGTQKFGLTIVTNIGNIKKGEVRAAAILPPKEFFGVVSEAMYCSGPIPKDFMGKRPPSNLLDVKAIASEVEAVLRKGR
jgi:predicted RNA-binding protein with EMAP domain